MKICKANKIIIFGGGTSGWLAAAYLSKNLTFPNQITLIEDTTLGPIGVGEGTQPATARFIHDCGIDPLKWMKPSQAAFKLGVEFVDWTDKKFFVDNDFLENTIIGPNLYTPDYFVTRPKEEFFDWLPAYQMAKANKSPKLAGLDTNYAQHSFRDLGAVHFAAFEIVKSLKDAIGDRITHVDTKIVDVETNDDGIACLIDKDGNKHIADLYVDCSGFSSILLEKNLKVEFESITDILPCDSAVAMPTQYKDPTTECHPYTKATAMPAGWRWTIPIYTRIGNGYVYSSKFTSPEEAEKLLRDTIGEYDAKANHLKMKCGIHKMVAYKNVMAAGLSAGFVEPLEATGITFTTKAVEMLTSALNKNNGIWHQSAKNTINEIYDRMYWEIVAFVWAHYHFSSKNDTPFWKKIHQQQPQEIPKKVLDVVGRFVNSPTREFYMNPESSFHVGHWFSVFHASDVYKNQKSEFDPQIEKYIEYYLQNNRNRVKLIMETFPNHYEYLKEWYAD